nr:ankyrin repeat domain-containing protein 26-like isoform X2 [Microcebus murinus]
MKKIFCFWGDQGAPPSRPCSGRGQTRVGLQGQAGDSAFLQPRYHIRKKDLGKIHQAARAGDVAKVEQVLSLKKKVLDARDRQKRTALHLACASGHPKVVTILVDRKCKLNVPDSEKRTALIKAVQCQEEECATVLLEHGADPNRSDVCGNTALHYAVYHENTSITEKLLSHGANIEAINKDHLTPLLLAISGKKKEMIEFLVKKNANINAVDKIKSIHLQASEYKEKIPDNLSQNSNPVDGISEDSTVRISTNLGIDDSWPTSDSEDFSVDKKDISEPNLTNLTTTSQQSRKNLEAKYATVRTYNENVFEDKISDQPNEDLFECVPATSAEVQGFLNPSFLPPELHQKPSFQSLENCGLTKDGATKPESGQKEHGIGIIENAPREQKDNVNFICVNKNNRSDKMSAFGSGKNEDAGSPQDLESISTNLPQKDSGDLRGAAVHKQKYMINGQEEEDLEVTSENEQERHEESENNQPQVEERENHKSNKMAVSENLYDAAADDSDDEALLQERKSGNTDSWQFPRMENEVCDRPAKKMSNEKNKVKGQIHSMGDHDDLTWSSETAPEDYSVSLLKMQDDGLSRERLVEIKSNHCERLTMKIKKMENKVSVLQDELHETKKINSQLMYEKAIWECELSTLRCTLKEEGEKRRNADMLYENSLEALRTKEEEYRKEVEVKQQLEQSLKTLNTEMSILRNYLSELAQKYNESQRQLYGEQNTRLLQGRILANQLYTQSETEMTLREMESEIFQGYEKEQALIRKNDMLHEEIAMLKMEIATIKYQNEEKEKKYMNDIKIFEEVNENLQMTLKQNVEKLTDTVSQYSDQLNALASENALLNAKLENEKQDKERLEAELEACPSRLTAAIHDLDQSEMLRRDVKMSLQRASHEWFCLPNEITVCVSNLKENPEIVGQKCSKAESKINSLENELHHTNVLGEKMLVLECVQRDLYQTKCQMKKMKEMYENEQYQVKKYIGQQEYLEERISELERENMLLQQQLAYAHSKAEDKEETLMNVREQFQDTVKNLLAENGKQSLLLEDRIKQLISECNQLKERLYQNEKGKPEEVLVRQLQELADSLEKTSTSEASQEVLSRHMNVENETPDSKKALDQIRNHIDDLTESLVTVSSRCRYLDAKNVVYEQELLSMKAIEKQCDILQKNNMKLEHELLNLQNYMEQNMVDRGQVQRYEQEIEERATQFIVEKLKEVNLFLQAQAAMEEYREQLRENYLAAISSEMEFRMKDLESEVSNMTNAREDFHCIELEKYKQLYQLELEDRKYLSMKLKKATERLAEFSSNLVAETQTRRFFATCTMSTVLQSASAGTPCNGFGLHREFTSTEYSLFSSSCSWTSDSSLKNNLSEMQQELEEITVGLEVGAAGYSPLEQLLL